MSQRTIYWICQIAGWSLYASFSLIMILVFGGVESISSGVIQLQVIIGTTLLTASHLFRLYAKRQKWVENKVWSLLPKVVISLLLVSVLSQLFINGLIYSVLPLEGITNFSWGAMIGYIGGTYLVMTFWATIYFSVKFMQRNRKNEIEKLELKAALQEAELAILKNQVNPHFLFNALNNIRSLILSDPGKARKMITHISELLRYSIQFNAAEKVSLSQELEIVQDYLQLESVQFNDRLTYDFEIAEDTLQVKIPPMAIQLLVENAIKHGISQLATGGNISIIAELQGEHLQIQVTNSGQLHKKGKREGIGLKNLMERLQILFGQFAELRLENSDKNTVTASLKIPVS